MKAEEIREVLTKGFAALDISREEVTNMAREVRACSTFEEAQARFNEFKASVKRRYREKALEWHPDRGGNEQTFKEFGQLLTALESIMIGRNGSRPVLSRPTRKTIKIVMVYRGTGTDSTSTRNPWEV